MPKVIFETVESKTKEITPHTNGEVKPTKSLNEILAGIKKGSITPYKPNKDIQLEIVFVTDTTGSMSSFITEAKKQIIKKLQNIESKIGVSIAMIEYKDHCDIKTTITHNFMNSQQFKGVLDKLRVVGGGDTAEAVLDGINEACKLNFSAKEKILFLVGDAPAHGIESDDVSDEYKDGCPCGLKLDKVANEVKKKGLKFYTIALNNCASKSFDFIAKVCGGNSYSFDSAYAAIENEIIPKLEQVTKLLLEESAIRL